MNENTHTSGPWKNVGNDFIARADGNWVAENLYPTREQSAEADAEYAEADAEYEANANLMAAAPQLLAAAEAALRLRRLAVPGRHLDFIDRANALRSADEIEEQIRAAVAAAKGEAS